MKRGLPFAMSCFLIRLPDCHRLEIYDCYHGRPPARPEWLKALESSL